MEKIYNKELQRIDFYLDGIKQDREIWKDNNLVYKRDKIRLNKDWRNRFLQIYKYISLPGFYDFMDDGYVMSFIDGPDLQGNSPFEMDNKKVDSILDKETRLKIIPIFGQATFAGEKLGYTLGDITCGNILVSNKELYLIDYEVIIPYPLDPDYIHIWNSTFQTIFKD